MRLRLIALGHQQPAWVDAAVNDYARRFPPEWPFELIELKPERRSGGRNAAQILALTDDTVREALSRFRHEQTQRVLSSPDPRRPPASE